MSDPSVSGNRTAVEFVTSPGPSTVDEQWQQLQRIMRESFRGNPVVVSEQRRIRSREELEIIDDRPWDARDSQPIDYRELESRVLRGTAYAPSEPPRIQGSTMLDKVYEAVAAFTRKWGHAPHYLILSENLFGALRTDPCVRGYIGPPVIQGTSNGDTQILGIETVIVPPPFGPVEVICGRRP